MTMRPVSFIQLADTQFGMFRNFVGLTKQGIEEYRRRGMTVQPVEPFDGFAPETERFEKALNAANQLRPEFVALCGDMVNDPSSSAQLAELERVSGRLAPDVPLYRVSGNHDASEGDHVTPTEESLARYRELFGDDTYSFSHGGAKFIVINSTVLHSPAHVRAEYDRQVDWLEAELVAARECSVERVIVLSHHPLFLEHPDEPAHYFNVPPDNRRPVIDLLSRYRVDAVFAGHMHQNNYAEHKGMLMIASGSVGYPLGKDPSGYRVVTVSKDAIRHRYYSLETTQTPASIP